MALKWKKNEFGGSLQSGPWRITSRGVEDCVLDRNGFAFCWLKTEAGCKRVANCIQREMDKDET